MRNGRENNLRWRLQNPEKFQINVRRSNYARKLRTVGYPREEALRVAIEQFPMPEYKKMVSA